MQTFITVSDTQKESYIDNYHINIVYIYIETATIKILCILTHI
jgi:hypothetical protein